MSKKTDTDREWAEKQEQSALYERVYTLEQQVKAMAEAIGLLRSGEFFDWPPR